MLILILACGKTNESLEQDSNKKFEWVSHESIFKNEIKEIEDISPLYFDKHESERIIKLSELISDFSYLKLENKTNHLLGDIDKILLTDSLVFIFDQYITNTVQIFDLYKGEELVFLEKSGEGPGEFLEVYDLDIDRSNKELILFDGKLSKILFYDFEGVFLREKKLPIRAQNFRKLNSGNYIFYSSILPNGHLEKAKECVYFVLSNDFEIESCFSLDSGLEKHGMYFARDYFSSDGENVFLFPRFQNQLLMFDFNGKILEEIVQIELEGMISEIDLKGDGQDFIEMRKNDKKYFSHGSSFVTSSVIGISFNRFSSSPFYFFQNRNSKKYLYGSGFGFDLPGMPFFSFPISSFKETSVSVIKLQQIRDIGVEKFLTSLEKKGLSTPELKKFLENVNDFDQPAILFTSYK